MSNKLVENERTVFEGQLSEVRLGWMSDKTTENDRAVITLLDEKGRVKKVMYIGAHPSVTKGAKLRYTFHNFT